MRKGDLKKQEILQTAEDLFCKKGYEETSVQDILDILHTSKGSFYHHFESKEYLLEAMCDRRAMLIAHQAEEEERAFVKPIARLNSLLSGVFPLKDERLSFLMMILPVLQLSSFPVLLQVSLLWLFLPPWEVPQKQSVSHLRTPPMALRSLLFPQVLRFLPHQKGQLTLH